MQPYRRTFRGAFGALGLVVLLLASAALGFGLTAHSGSSAPATAGTTVPATGAPSAIVTHGDLWVTNGETYVIQPPSGYATYYQGGNITVLAGGTLIVRNSTISFVQFVGTTGTAQARLSHVFHFLDEGTVDLYNSSVTTDLLLINDYPKLPITVEGAGQLNLRNSSLQFPGWLNVEGATASVTLNNSSIGPNPAAGGLDELTAVAGDTAFAPDLNVSAGGSLNLFGSNVSGLYQDNLTANGTPRPLGDAQSGLSILNTSRVNATDLSTPNDTANLTQDWLYPSGVTGGEVVAYYNNSVSLPTSSDVTVYFDGGTYDLGTITFEGNTFSGIATVPFTPGLTAAVNAAGLLGYLNSTGDFGAGPSRIAIAFSGTTGPSLFGITASFVLNPPLSYSITVTGDHSRVSTLDTSIGLTFGPTAASPLSLVAPYPWKAIRVVLTDGATAYLANLTVPNLLPTSAAGAISADDTSQAYLYRWAQFNLTGKGGILPVVGGTVTPYYAYPSNQTNNATVTALNDIATNNTALAGYLAYLDAINHVAVYGSTNSKGIANLLLASNEITGGSLWNGYFLGDYHVVASVPTGSTQSYNWAVSAYPAGVALLTPGYGAPDLSPGLTFPSYFAAVDVKAVTIAANGTVVANGTVRIGQLFGANVTVQDTGAAPIYSVRALLFYNQTEETLLDTANLTTHLTVVGETVTLNVSWLVNDSVTGLHGSFVNGFWVAVQWNNLEKVLGGGQVNQTVNTTIAPSQVKVVFTPPTSVLDRDTYYHTFGTVLFNGSEAAKLSLTATPSGGGTTIYLVNGTSINGTFELSWSSSELAPGVNYVLKLTATYNTVTATRTAVGTFSLAPVPAPSASSFLEHKYLGLPLWIWLAIVAAIVVGVVLFFFFSRRTAAGKLVECGECGALIPENAAACPKCGAEFESDLVRCSRCAATIPASSKSCPECSAQLLGKPGEGTDDPERQGYEDFIERYRAEGKKELGDNYTEGAFWDWWKRQATYTPFSQWKLQQGAGTARAGMTAPPAGPAAPTATPAPRPAPRPARPSPAATPPPARAAAPAADAKSSTAPTPPPAASTAAPSGGLKPCPTCGKEIPPEYLVCPFCGSVTQ